MPQKSSEKRVKYLAMKLTMVLPIIVGGMFVSTARAATPTVNQSSVPVEIVKTEPVAANGIAFKKVTLRNVSGKSIVFLRIFVSDDHHASLVVNCFLRDEGAWNPNQEITVDVQPSDPFALGVVVYTDLTTSGEAGRDKVDSDFVRGWTDALQRYKLLIAELKQQHSADKTSQLLAQRLLQDQAQAGKSSLADSARNNGSLGVYHYFYVVLTNANNKQAALDSLETAASRITMEGAPR